MYIVIEIKYIFYAIHAFYEAIAILATMGIMEKYMLNTKRKKNGCTDASVARTQLLLGNRSPWSK